MPLPTDLPANRVTGQTGHTEDHNVIEQRIDDIALAVNALTADPDLDGLLGLGDGNPHRVSGTWSVRSDSALASALGVSGGSGGASSDAYSPRASLTPASYIAASGVAATSADDFATGTTLTGRSTPTGSLAWTQNVGTWTISGGAASTASGDGALATFAGGSARCTVEAQMVASDNGSSTAAYPCLVFRGVDASNFFYVSLDTLTHFARAYRVTAGGHNLLCESRLTLTSGQSVAVRVDINGPDFTVWVGGQEIVTVTDTQGVGATRVGFRNGAQGSPPANAKFDSITVTPLRGPVYNWPRTVRPAAGPIVARGATGTWDSTDINNPNVVWDHANRQWVLYYSGYRNDGSSSGVQGMGLAYAASLDGTWTKDPANPVFTDSGAGGFNMNGGLVCYQGQWLHAYVSGSGTTISLTRSPDLHTWTNQGLIVDKVSGTWEHSGVFDPFLRIRQDGVTLELWYAAANSSNVRGIGRATSIDGGATWQKDPGNPIMTLPSFADGGTFAEPAVYVPAGKEGQEMLLMCDVAHPSAGSVRRICQAITIDGGGTWHWRTVAEKFGTSGTYAAGSVFDSFPVVHAGRFYLFHSASPIGGAALDMGIQIGMQSGEWQADTFRVAGSPLADVPDTTAPSVPTGLTATPGNTQVALSWTASTDNVAVTGYKVRQGGTVVATPTAASSTITGLTNGTSYSFTVSALDAAGNESAQSGAVSATPSASTLTNTVLPTITGTATVGQVLTASNGTWSATPDSFTYQWKRSGTAISGATASTYTLVSADAGSTITVTVTASKAGFTSGSATSNPTGTVGGGGGTTLVADDFTASDGTALAGRTTPTGAKTWSTTGTFTINSNKVDSAGTDGNLATLDSGVADGTVQVDVTSATQTYNALVFRYVDASNFFYYQLAGPASFDVQLYRVVSGSHVQLATASPGVGTSCTLKVTLSGSTITLFCNGTQVGSPITDTNHQTATKVGFRLGFNGGSSSGTWDNLVVTT